MVLNTCTSGLKVSYIIIFFVFVIFFFQTIKDVPFTALLRNLSIYHSINYCAISERNTMDGVQVPKSNIPTGRVREESGGEIVDM